MTDRDALTDRLEDIEDTVRATDTIRVLIERRAVDDDGEPLPEAKQPDPTVVEM